MEIQAWDDVHGAKSEEKLEAFLESRTDSYAILQLRETDEARQNRFMGYAWLQKQGKEPQFDQYEVVYAGNLPVGTGPEDLFARFNRDHPDDFTGHSLSVSDIVALKQNDVVTCLYTDNVGFRQLQNFLPGEYLKNAEMAMEDDYGMIDGVINNGTKAEEWGRPSVRDRLKSSTEENGNAVREKEPPKTREERCLE